MSAVVSSSGDNITDLFLSKDTPLLVSLKTTFGI